MTGPSFFERLKRARIVQVLLVYMGASWGVLQIADTLSGALSLPEWVLPTAVLLLMVGLVIILATAWVQSLPTTTAKEEAGEIPGDWQVAPADALASLKAGKVPHLTWGRAVVGGAVALSFLFGGAGLYVMVTGTRAPGFGPREAGADVAAAGIAVVPFDVRGQGLEIWREGMVDLLSNNMDGVGGFRTIDPRTVLARWKEGVGDDPAPDLDVALRAAGATGARYALVGSVVGIGDNVRIVSNVYDLDTRKEVAQGQAEGPSGDVLRLVDDLAVGTIRSLLSSTGREGAGDLTAETLTTGSLDALREFLEGERHYRRGEFAEAVQSFERAVAADTSFAIGLVRLSEAYGWLEAVGSEKMQEYGDKAVAHTDRLPPRYQFIMSAWDALNRQSAEGLPVLWQAVQKYPDDPEAWFLLAETLLHVPNATYATVEEIQQALDRAVALDPNFAPYLVHVADMAIVSGDRVGAEAALARYEALAGNDRAVGSAKLAIPLLLGDSLEAEGALQAARTVPPAYLDQLLGSYQGWTDRFDRLSRLRPVWAEVSGRNQDAIIAWGRVSQGALASAADFAVATHQPPASFGTFFGHQFELWGVPPRGKLAEHARPSVCAEPYSTQCNVFLAVALAGTGRWDDLSAAVRRVRQAADESASQGDSTGAAFRLAAAQVMEGLGLWRRGDLDGARRALTPHTGVQTVYGGRAMMALAELELSQGRWDQAIRHAQGQVHGYARPGALYVQAKAHEGKGDTARAREAWRHFVATTRLGDDDVPRIREGREALARLAG